MVDSFIRGNVAMGAISPLATFLLNVAAVLIVFTNFVKPTKKWHPIIFIGISAVVGIVFHFGGV